MSYRHCLYGLYALLVTTGACKSSPEPAPSPHDAGADEQAGSAVEPAAGSGGNGGALSSHIDSGAAGQDAASSTGGSGGAGRGGDAGDASIAMGGAGGKDASAADGGSDAGMPKAGATLLLGVGDWGLRGRSSDGMTWIYCGNKSTGNDHSPDLLRNVGYGDGVFIAVGGDANGMVMRSLDGARWQEDVHPTTACKGEGYPSSCTNWMGGVAYLDGVWLAGGGNGASMRSTDGGLTWTGVHGGFPEKHIRSMGAGSGRFIAGTDGGALFVTQDNGDHWTMHADVWTGAASNAYLNFAHANGTFVAYSVDESASARACFVSTDMGDHWSACDAMVKTSMSFVHDGTQWVAPVSGGYATSPDAKTWTKHTASNVPSQLLLDGTTWFGRSGTNAYRGATLDSFASTGAKVPDYRAWTIGKVYAENMNGSGAVCADNR